MIFLLAGVIPTSSAELLVVAGVIYTVAATIIQRKLSNPKRSRELQDQIMLHSKEFREMIKRNAPKEELDAKQKVLMPLHKESMTLNMKSLFVLMPSYLVVYYLVLPYLFGSLGVALLTLHLGSYNLSLQYRNIFFITTLVLGVGTSVGILLYDKRRAKIDVKPELAAEGIKE